MLFSYMLSLSYFVIPTENRQYIWKYRPQGRAAVNGRRDETPVSMELNSMNAWRAGRGGKWGDEGRRKRQHE
jgi:hypothetical protein